MTESRAEPRRDRLTRSHELTSDTLRSYIHQLYGGERERHSAPSGSAPQRAREAAASTSRASRLSEQRPAFWHGSLAKVRGSVSRQLSKESNPPAEVIDRVIANKLETLTKVKPTDSLPELTIRNVARHDKRSARPVSSREKQQRIAAWLLQVERALGDRRRQQLGQDRLET
ncbi:uncharacterized protein LOC119094166 [Pollicipes pollicipes]|uniref:uncharacterized protein LOC119094166 n=1 Tax=Pollicipes pollicipes TaxID=41117 RepID=UPI0018856197|nr:uncharacterized protein LOC119094166 [Pollicipes pollicipes]